MSNIEKLRQKIENSIKAFEFNGGIYDSYEAGELSAYQEILNIIDSLPEEKPSEDLKEEVKRYYSDNFTYISSDQPTLSILTNVARHFAYWQKEQMMKDAVEGEIVKDITNKLAVTAKNINLKGFKFGDKVKIIILKDGE